MMKKEPDEAPRGRLLACGVDSMTTRELLAILLDGDSLATRMLGRSGRHLAPISRERALFCAVRDGAEAAIVNDLRGLSETRRARIAAAFELARRYARFRDSEVRGPLQDQKLSKIEEAGLSRIPDSLRQAEKEWIGFVPFYSAGSIGEFCLVERGVRTHVMFDPQALFVRALSLRAIAIILVHNHPSGNMEASRDDRRLTTTVDDISESLGITLLGHWIVSGPRQTRINMRLRSDRHLIER